MIIRTFHNDLRKARLVNQTSTTFVSKLPTVTIPNGDAGTATGASVIEIGNASFFGYPAVKVFLYGAGSNNNTLSCRLIGWELVGGLWIPSVLCEIQGTLSTVLRGVVGQPVSATEYFADTMTLTYGNANVSVELFSPANDIMAHAMVSVKDSRKLEFSFSRGSSATNCNALFKL